MLLYAVIDQTEQTIKNVAFKFIDFGSLMQTLNRTVEGSEPGLCPALHGDAGDGRETEGERHPLGEDAGRWDHADPSRRVLSEDECAGLDG